MENPTPPSLYDTFDKNLYRIGTTNDATVTGALMNGTGGSTVDIAQNAIASGGSTDIKDMYVGAVAGGKTTFDNLDTGYILGIDRGVPKFYLGNSTNYISFDGSTTTIVGGLSVDSLDIPDTTTANSFHVDINGNTWWGANVATGYSGANAYVLATGAAVFKNIVIGGTAIQYVITNSGIFSFGDGSDGTATCDGSTSVAGMSLSMGNYTMTRDVYFDELTIDSGVIVYPNGYRIFAKTLFTVNGTVDRSGSNGGDAVGQIGGAGTSQSDGYLIGGASGGAGGNGGNSGGSGTNGSAGEASSNCLGSSGSAGGDAGYNGGGLPAAGNGGALGAATASNVRLIANWHLATLLDISSSGSTVKFTPNGGAGGGGGGGGDNVVTPGGGGGGGGCGGGMMAIYAKNLVIGAAGVVKSNGGNGGDGQAAGNPPFAGSGGGGSAGNGGVIVLVYNTYTNSGSVTVTGGTKGSRGITSPEAATPAEDGQDGSAGVVYQFQLSL